MKTHWTRGNKCIRNWTEPAYMHGTAMFREW